MNLKKLFRFQNVDGTTFVSCYQELIDADNYFIGARQCWEPSVKWNRHKFNRLSGNEQDEYQRKLDKTKAVYYLISKAPGGRENYHSVSKSVFDYYQGKHPENAQEDAKPAEDPMKIIDQYRRDNSFGKFVTAASNAARDGVSIRDPHKFIKYLV
jgi:hypothetical protein